MNMLPEKPHGWHFFSTRRRGSVCPETPLLSSASRVGRSPDPESAVALHIADANVVFIGEKHNDPVAHHLELEIL